MTRPEFLYKYRQDTDRQIDALMSCKAIFSGRKGLNDPYDAKFNLVQPSILELERVDLASRVCQDRTAVPLPRFIKNGKITSSGNEFLQTFYKVCDELIESYRFYCLSANPTSGLMWAHYSGDHTGFCISFRSEHAPGNKVIYEDRPLEIRLSENLVDAQSHALGQDIWRGLRTKQTIWEYEEEYRLQASNEAQRQFVKVAPHSDAAEYDPDWVDSIIFGLRMPLARRRTIMQSYKHPVKFKEVVMSGMGFTIVDLS